MYMHHSNVSPLPRRAPLIGSKAKASLVVEPHSWGSLLGPSLASLVKLLPPLVGAASYVEPGLGEELSIQDSTTTLAATSPPVITLSPPGLTALLAPGLCGQGPLLYILVFEATIQIEV
jgi:hypothetical protein